MAARTLTAGGQVGRSPVDPGVQKARPNSEQARLAALIAARLVVASNEHPVEVTHDALFAYWPRLRDWLDGRSLAIGLAAAIWIRLRRPRGGPLAVGTPMCTAGRASPQPMDWRADHPADVSSVEDEFLDASARAAGRRT